MTFYNVYIGYTLLSPKVCLRALWVSGIFVFNLRIYHHALRMSSIENDSLGSDKYYPAMTSVKTTNLTVDDFPRVVYRPEEKYVVNIALFCSLSIFL